MKNESYTCVMASPFSFKINFFNKSWTPPPRNTCRLIIPGSPFPHFRVKITRTFQWAAWTWRHRQERGRCTWRMSRVAFIWRFILGHKKAPNVFDDGDYKLLFSETFAPFRAAILHPAASWHLLAITNEFYSAGYTSISLNFLYCFLRPPIKSSPEVF